MTIAAIEITHDHPNSPIWLSTTDRSWTERTPKNTQEHTRTHENTSTAHKHTAARPTSIQSMM